MNKPDIRFNGFNGDWEEKNYKEVFDTSVSNNTLSRAELTSEKTSTKNVHYGDILIKYNSILSVKKDDFPFIPDTVRIDSKNFLKNGDIVFADTAEDETCGKAVEITDLENENVLAGLHTFVARPKFQFQEKYLGYFINSPAYHNQLIPYMQGTKVTSISKTNVQKTSVKYPNATEQTKIGNLFSQIDSLISSTQKEHDKLVALKKCMLQKMFPKKGCLVPEIRFKGFTGEWMETKFYNIGTVKSGYAFQSENFLNQGIPVIRITNIQDGEVFFDEIVYYSEFDIDKDFIAERGDILLAMSGATTGKTGVYKREQSSYINQRVGKFIFNDETTFKPFYKSLFDTEFFMEQVIGSVATGAQPNIGTKNVENMIFTIPIDKNEQQKIGSYFQNLDNLISRQSAELEKLKNVKKTLLSKMFV